MTTGADSDLSLWCLLDAAYIEDKDFWKNCPKSEQYERSHIRGMLAGAWALSSLTEKGIEGPTREDLNAFAESNDFYARF